MPWLNRLRSLAPVAKWSVIALICMLATVVVAMLRPIPQPLSYHNFADTRRLLGIPRAFDVLSNLPFLIVGLLGMAFTLHPGSRLERSAAMGLRRTLCGSVLDRNRFGLLPPCTGQSAPGRRSSSHDGGHGRIHHGSPLRLR